MIIFAVLGGVYLLFSKAATNRIPINPGTYAVSVLPAGSTSDYWIVASDGGVFSMGTNIKFFGSMAGKPLVQRITSSTARPQHDGYWMLGGDGGIFSFGNAKYLSGPTKTATSGYYRAIVGTPSGNGYWVITKLGSISPFGDAATTYWAGINASYKRFNTNPLNALPGLPVNGIVSAARTVSGKGLILLAENGATYGYGDAPYHGNVPINYAGGQRATSITVDNKNGYIVAANNGATYGLGGTYRGGANTAGQLAGPIISIASTSDSGGYWELGQDGGIFAYGNALFKGSVVTTTPLPASTPTLTTVITPQPITTPAPSIQIGSSITVAAVAANPCSADLQNNITVLQECLNSRGANPKLTVDGVLGPLTRQTCSSILGAFCPYPVQRSGGGNTVGAAVIPVSSGAVSQLQKDIGVSVDGQVGNQTLFACNANWQRLSKQDQYVCALHGGGPGGKANNGLNTNKLANSFAAGSFGLNSDIPSTSYNLVVQGSNHLKDGNYNLCVFLDHTNYLSVDASVSGHWEDWFNSGEKVIADEKIPPGTSVKCWYFSWNSTDKYINWWFHNPDGATIGNIQYVTIDGNVQTNVR